MRAAPVIGANDGKPWSLARLAGNLLPPTQSEGLVPVPSGAGALSPHAASLFQPEKEKVQLGRYWAAVKRYRWLILLVVLGGTALGFVITRFVHAGIFVTSNNVPQRGLVWFAGVVVLLVMWVYFALRMMLV